MIKGDINKTYYGNLYQWLMNPSRKYYFIIVYICSRLIYNLNQFRRCFNNNFNKNKCFYILFYLIKKHKKIIKNLVSNGIKLNDFEKEEIMGGRLYLVPLPFVSRLLKRYLIIAHFKFKEVLIISIIERK